MSQDHPEDPEPMEGVDDDSPEGVEGFAGEEGTESAGDEEHAEGVETIEGAGTADLRRTTLPPPAFPPGARRRVGAERVVHPTLSRGGEPREIPDDAFISPDDPIRKEGRGIPDDAFISPDDPLVPARRDEEGHVTGLGVLTVPPSQSGSSRRGAPNIHELPYLLDQLAEQLHESGEKALEVNAEMGHFQAALRSFLRGYLGRTRD